MAGARSGPPADVAEPADVAPRGPVVLSEPDLRAFYDPAGRHRHEPLPVLLDQVAATRVPFTLAPLGPLAGHEVILAEALHACLGPQACRAGTRPGDAGADGEGRIDASAVLPVAPRRQQAIAAAVDRYATAVAAAVLEVADDLAVDLLRLQDRVRGLLGEHRHAIPGRLVLAGRVLAAVAHEGVVRRSGRDYYCHPDEVASILSAAWRRQARSETDPRLLVGRFLAYCHDGFEDTLDPVGSYLSELPVIVSPRVVLAVLRSLAVPDAMEIARVLLLMTRTEATDGSRMDYLDYLDRGIAEGNAYFVLTKAGDVHHNLTIEPEDIDPADRRAPARYAKRELYRRAANRLREAGDDHDHDIAWTVHTTFAVRASEFRPSLRTDTASVRQVAAAVRDQLVGRLRPAAPEVPTRTAAPPGRAADHTLPAMTS